MVVEPSVQALKAKTQTHSELGDPHNEHGSFLSYPLKTKTLGIPQHSNGDAQTSHVNVVNGFFETRDIHILRDVLLAEKDLQLSKEGYVLDQNSRIYKNKNGYETVIATALNIEELSGLKESILMAIKRQTPKIQIIFPYRMTNLHHWVTGQILIENKLIKLIVHDSALCYQKYNENLGKGLKEFFEGSMGNLLNFLRREGSIFKTDEESKILLDLLFDSKGAPRFVFEDKGRSDIYSIQGHDVYCGGYATRLMINLTLCSLPNNIRSRDIWGCSQFSDSVLRQQDYEKVKSINRRHQINTRGFGASSRGNEYIHSREHIERTEKQNNETDRLLIAILERINKISKGSQEKICKKIMNLEQNENRPGEKVRQLYTFCERELGLIQKDNPIAFFFRFPEMLITSESSFNSEIVLPILWLSLFNYFKKNFFASESKALLKDENEIKEAKDKANSSNNLQDFKASLSSLNDSTAIKGSLIAMKQVQVLKQTKKITRSYANASRLTEKITIKNQEGIREALARFSELTGKESHIYWYHTHLKSLKLMLSMAEEEQSCKKLSNIDVNYIIERCSHKSSFIASLYETEIKIIRTATKILTYLAQHRIALSQSARKVLLSHLESPDTKVRQNAILALCYAIHNDQNLFDSETHEQALAKDEKEKTEKKYLDTIDANIKGLTHSSKILENLPMILVGYSALVKKGKQFSDEELSIIQRSLVYIGSETVNSFYPKISFRKEFYSKDRRSWFSLCVTHLRKLKQLVKTTDLHQDELLYVGRRWRDESESKLKRKAILILKDVMARGQAIEEHIAVSKALKEASQSDNRKTKNAALVALGYFIQHPDIDRKQLTESLNSGLSMQRKLALSALNNFLRLNENYKFKDLAAWIKILECLQENKSEQDHIHEISNMARFLIFRLNKSIAALESLLLDPGFSEEATLTFIGAVQQRTPISLEAFNNLTQILISPSHHRNAKFNTLIILKYTVDNNQRLSKNLLTEVFRFLDSHESPIRQACHNILGSYALLDIDAVLTLETIQALSKAILQDENEARGAAGALRNIVSSMPKIRYEKELIKVLSDIINIINENGRFSIKIKLDFMLVLLQAAQKKFNFSALMLLNLSKTLNSNNSLEIQVRILETLKLIIENQDKIVFPDEIIFVLLAKLKENKENLHNDITAILMKYIEKTHVPLNMKSFNELRELLKVKELESCITDILRSIVSKGWELPKPIFEELANSLRSEDIDARIDAAWIFRQVALKMPPNLQILSRLYDTLKIESEEEISDNVVVALEIYLKQFSTLTKNGESINGLLDQEVMTKLTHILLDINKENEIRISAIQILEIHATKLLCCFESEIISSLTSILSDPGVHLCKSVISILRHQMHYYKKVDSSISTEVKEILLKLEEKIKEKDLIKEVLLFLKSKPQQCDLTDTLLDSLADVLLVNQEPEIRVQAFDILAAQFRNGQILTEKAATVLKLETSGIYLNTRKRQPAWFDYNKNIKEIQAIIKNGHPATQSNIKIFEDIFGNYLKSSTEKIELERAKPIVMIVYHLTLNQHVLSNSLQEMLGETIGHSNIIAKYAFLTLINIAHNGHFIPSSVFKKVENFVNAKLIAGSDEPINNKKLEQSLILLDVGSKRHISFEERTISKLISFLQTSDNHSKRMISKILNQAAENPLNQAAENPLNQKTMCLFIDAIIAHFQANNDIEVLKNLSLCVRKISMNCVFQLKVSSLTSLVESLAHNTSFEASDNILIALNKIKNHDKFSKEIDTLIQLRQAEHLVLDESRENTSVLTKIANLELLKEHGGVLSQKILPVISKLLLDTNDTEKRRLLSVMTRLQMDMPFSTAILEEVAKLFNSNPTYFDETQSFLLGSLKWPANFSGSVVDILVQAIFENDRDEVRVLSTRILKELTRYQTLLEQHKFTIENEIVIQTLSKATLSSKMVDERQIMILVENFKHRIKNYPTITFNATKFLLKSLLLPFPKLHVEIIKLFSQLKFKENHILNEEIFASLVYFTAKSVEEKIDSRPLLLICNNLLDTHFITEKCLNESIQTLEKSLSSTLFSILPFRLLTNILKHQNGKISHDLMETTLLYLLSTHEKEEQNELLIFLSFAFRQDELISQKTINLFVEIIQYIICGLKKEILLDRIKAIESISNASLPNLVSRINKSKTFYSLGIKTNLIKLFGYVYRKQIDSFNNLESLYSTLFKPVLECINVQSSILPNLESVNVRKKLNFLLSLAHVKFSPEKTISGLTNIHPDLYVRELLRTELFMRVSALNHGKETADNLEIFRKFLDELEMNNRYNFYCETRDNLLTLLIEKQEFDNLNLGNINELLVLLSTGHQDPVYFLMHSGKDVKFYWLRNILVQKLNILPDEVEIKKVINLIEKLQWPIKLTHIFSLTVLVPNILQLRTFLEFLIAFEVTSKDLFDVISHGVSLQKLSLNDLELIVKKEIIFGILSSVTNLFANHKATKIPENLLEHIEKQLGHRIIALLNLGWSFEKFHSLLTSVKTRLTNDKFVNVEQLSLLFDLVHCYKITEKEFEKIYQRIVADEELLNLVKSLHVDCIRKCHRNNEGEKNREQLIFDLIKENEERKNDNPSYLKLVQENTLIKFVDKMNDEYEKGKYPIKNWTPVTIERWREKLTKEEAKNPSHLPEILAVIKRVCFLHSHYEPREVQIIAVLSLLFRENAKGRFLQVSTGEGKSIIIAILAVIKALQGETVDIVTSSPDLARRDTDEYQKFYNHFGLKAGCNGEQKYTSGLKSCYGDTISIVYGYVNDFQFDILRHEYNLLNTRGKRGFGFVIVDEVDNLLIDEGSRVAMLASAMPGLDSLKPIFILVWLELQQIVSRFRFSIDGYVYYDEKNIDKTISEKIGEIWDKAKRFDFIKQKLKIYSEKVTQKDNEFNIVIPNHLENFVKKQSDKWIQNAISANFHYKLGREYTIRQDFYGILSIVPVDFANTGVVQVGTSWGDGLHQFLQIKHGLEITSESLVVNFISNMAFISRYGSHVYGLTGTLGSLEARNLLSEIYQIDFVYIPTYRNKQFSELPSITNLSDTEWNYEIEMNVIREARNGRVVLLLCETMDDANAFDAILSSDRYSDLRIRRYIGNEDEKNHFLNDVQDENTIIISTNLAGRGTDIRVSRKVIENGGLHVCFSFLPLNLRVEEQGFGRAGRRGELGTAQLILSQKDIVTKLGRSKKLAFIDLFDIQQIREIREEIEKEHLDNVRKKEFPQTKNKDKLYEGFRSLLLELNQIDKKQDTISNKIYRLTTRNEIPYKRKAIEERWGIWLKEHNPEDSSDITLNEFDNFKKTILEEYQTNNVVKNPYYYISEATQLIEYVSSIKGKLSQLGMTTELYTLIIEILDKAVKLDPHYCYMAHYNKIFALMQLASSGYKDIAKNAANRVIHLVSNHFLEQTLAISHLLRHSTRKPNGEYHKALSNQLICRTQALQMVIHSCKGIVEEIEKSQKLMSLSFQEGSENILFDKLNKDQILKMIEDNKQYSISFHGLRAHPDLKVKYQALNTIDNIPENTKVNIEFTEQNILHSGHTKKAFKFLLAINRKLKEESEALEKKKEEDIQKNEVDKRVGNMEHVKHYASKAYDGVTTFFRGAGEVVSSVVAPLGKGADRVVDYLYELDEAESIPVQVKLEFNFVEECKNFLKEIREKNKKDSKNAIEKRNIQIVFHNSTKEFLDQVTKEFSTKKSILTLKKRDKKNNQTFYAERTITDLTLDSNFYSCQFDELSLDHLDNLIEIIEKITKSLKKLDAINPWFKSIIIKFPNLKQTEANILLDISHGTLTLGFISLNKVEAKRIIYVTEKYNKDGIFTVNNLNMHDAKSIVEKADREEENFNVFKTPIENFLTKLNNSRIEILECKTNGLVFIYNIQEQNRRPWLNIGLVTILGCLQIVGGVLLMGLTAGFAANFGMALIGEGVGDLLKAGSAIYYRDFSWSSYFLQKSVSLSLSLATAGISSYRAAKVALTAQELATDLIDEAAFQAAAMLRTRITESGFVMASNHLLATSIEVGASTAANALLDVASAYGLEHIHENVVKLVNDELKIKMQDAVWKNYLNKIYTADQFLDNTHYRDKLMIRTEGIIKCMRMDSLGINVISEEVISEFETAFTRLLAEEAEKVEPFYLLLFNKLQPRLDKKAAQEIGHILIQQNILMKDGKINLDPLAQHKNQSSSQSNLILNPDLINRSKLKLGKYIRYRDDVIDACISYALISMRGHASENDTLRKEITQLFSAKVTEVFEMLLGVVKQGASTGINMAVSAGTSKLTASKPKEVIDPKNRTRKPIRDTSNTANLMNSRKGSGLPTDTNGLGKNPGSISVPLTPNPRNVMPNATKIMEPRNVERNIERLQSKHSSFSAGKDVGHGQHLMSKYQLEKRNIWIQKSQNNLSNHRSSISVTPTPFQKPSTTQPNTHFLNSNHGYMKDSSQFSKKPFTPFHPMHTDSQRGNFLRAKNLQSINSSQTLNSNFVPRTKESRAWQGLHQKGTFSGTGNPLPGLKTQSSISEVFFQVDDWFLKLEERKRRSWFVHTGGGSTGTRSIFGFSRGRKTLLDTQFGVGGIKSLMSGSGSQIPLSMVDFNIPGQPNIPVPRVGRNSIFGESHNSFRNLGQGASSYADNPLLFRRIDSENQWALLQEKVYQRFRSLPSDNRIPIVPGSNSDMVSPLSRDSVKLPIDNSAAQKPFIPALSKSGSNIALSPIVKMQNHGVFVNRIVRESLLMVQQSFLNEYKLYSERCYAHKEALIKQLEMDFNEKGCDQFNIVLEEHKKLIKILIGYILIEQELDSNISSLTLESNLDSQNLSKEVQEKALNILDEAMKDLGEGFIKVVSLVEKEKKVLNTPVKDTDNNHSTDENNPVVYKLLKDAFEEFWELNQLLKEKKMSSIGEAVVGMVAKVDLNKGLDLFGKHLESKNYSQAGLLLKDGKLGEAGFLAGTVIEGLMKSHAITAESNARVKYMLTKLAGKIVELNAQFQDKLVNVVNARTELVKALEASYAERWKSVDALVTKVVNDGSISESRVQLAMRHLELTESAHRTTMEIAKANGIEKTFLENSLKASRELMACIMDGIKVICKQEKSNLDVLAKASTDLFTGILNKVTPSNSGNNPATTAALPAPGNAGQLPAPQTVPLLTAPSAAVGGSVAANSPISTGQSSPVLHAFNNASTATASSGSADLTPPAATTAVTPNTH